MKPNSTSSPGQPKNSRFHPLMLAGLAFVLGIALTGIWFHRHHSGSETGGLSASTKNLLGQLGAPVTIHYYSLLPAGSADETLQAFAGRVAQLLNAMQTASGGKIQLASFSTPDAASAGGIQPFNLEKGDACFLGLTIASGKNQEVFARLSPEWEPALEFDLARAIQRVAAPVVPAGPAPEVAQPSPEIIASINRLIPDVSGVTADQADQIFHAEFLKQCSEVGTEAENQINAAQQKVMQAQTSGDTAGLEAAQKNLAQVQLAQGEKLKDIATQLQTRLAVFQRMKAGTNNATK